MLLLQRLQKLFGQALLAAIVLCGCRGVEDQRASEALPQKIVVLQRVSVERARAILSDLGLGVVSAAVDTNNLTVSGLPTELEKAAVVLDLVDADDDYVVQNLAPASAARALPSNDQIARAVGDLAIGTFSAPPESGRARGIIDVQGETLVAIVPAHLWPDVLAVVRFGTETTRLQKNPDSQRDRREGIDRLEPDDHPFVLAADQRDLLDPPPTAPHVHTSERSKVVPRQPESGGTQADSGDLTAPSLKSHARQEVALPVGPPTDIASDSELQPDPNDWGGREDRAHRGVFKPVTKSNGPATTPQGPAAVSFPDGDDVIELSLPEKINLIQLIELVAEYLRLDCLYEADKIGNQVVTLKLHSKIKSEITVRDLYSILETALRFRGLVMVRHEGNLVTIVPAAEVLNVDPQLVDPDSRTLQPGDMVVTRVFQLQHVGVAGVVTLLQNMKLGVAISAIEETQTLFVTCYARRMARIEQLVHMVDRPGSAREFRFRQMKHTLAPFIAQKVLTLAEELQGIPIAMAPAQEASAPARPPGRTRNTAEPAAREKAVYLDTDDRTNRILMIGYEEQLETVEGLIDMLDIPSPDRPVLRQYAIRLLDAGQVVEKLNALDIAGAPDRPGSPPKGGRASSPETVDAKPQIVLLEATNSLLIHATGQQHQQIATVIGYVDVAPQETRTLKTYHMRHADADEVVRKLQELGFIGQSASPGNRPGRTASAGQPAPAGATEGARVPDLQVVVLDATNSLLVYATDPQHELLQAFIPYIDVEVRRERVPYEIYFLENQDPERMAEVLGRLVQETVVDTEGKVEQVLRKTEDKVTIIPDTGTFSLIVYASRKNQEWVADLVRQLDKRRPQVLIDVTLVEITKTEAFTYDLNLIQSLPDLTATSGLTGAIGGGVSSSDIMDKLSTSGRSQFADYQSRGGDFTGFYGDKHINLLLEAMQSKNYGRVLAKPKILVNDNQPGMIKTTDTTYVTKRSSIPISSGGAGMDATLIETAVDYQSYEAGITLNITPHISQGELLRLDIELIRSDFRETENSEKPPDTTASELTTTVFVPDGSTIILGGLLKMNQNKGGAKVPILGDIPLIGGLFRSINNKDTQNKLYVFVKAEIIRPGSTLAQTMKELNAISDRNREAFEEHEREFQTYQNWPGVKPKPVEPPRVLEAR